MPNQPYLDPTQTKRDGLAFLGLSLSRKSSQGHRDTYTHQEAFDLNEVLDRDYEHLMSSNDDGWLVGGGEPGPPTTYKLAARDSAHVEIMRIGTYRPEWGGIGEEEIVEAIQSGKILIPQVEALPTAVVANPDNPPELEIRFDMDPAVPNFDDPDAELPVNWQLRFIHNQLFKHFVFPSRFCPGPFHSTILRKADWRSPEHKAKYFEKCDAVIKKWREGGPKPLNTGWDVDGTALDPKPEFCSGIWLFVDRVNITHRFPPNFLPPYDGEKKRIILDFLKEEWDEDELKWKPVGC
mmetsp:Transcript_29188/g.63346  ORF Transcript_29188/g.63346 Transcript_29188/m.63346 type:complete len:294 (+) Transcript_29188:119-1000(+)